ncbi:MAG TPA: type VI secretion system baseplate subunit TssG [Noviherbaspirillum sp.]|nr:type VI secretion system baseplate subunit TssG [Noviherbaspirillum sp.]
MPGTKRRIRPSLIQRLTDEPHRFEFFQAVRVLLGYHRHCSDKQDIDVLGQAIRFRSSVSLAFPPSEIESLEIEWHETATAEGDKKAVNQGGAMPFKRATLTPAFIGLTGPLGILPQHYTQHVAEREIYHRDTATRAFLDIFNSRAVALFYQSWLKYRLHLQYEADRKNRFLPIVLSFAGLGQTGLRDRLADDANGISDESLAYYAGALRQRPQSVQWFSRVVADYFQVSCSVEQFVGQWFELPEHEWTRLGMTNCALGDTAFCGARVWDRQSKVRLTIGPLRQRQFDDFLPNGAAYRNLCRFFRLAVGATFDCEVRLILDKRDVTAACLDSQGVGTRLGWNGWFKSRSIWSDARDTAFLINADGHA